MSFQHSQVKRRSQYPSRKQQQGVVIVVALFIVALVVVMAYAMISRLDRDMRRTSLLLRDAQADFYAQGSVVWALDQLKKNGEKLKSNPDQIVDKLPIKSPVNQVKGFHISSVIDDMQARFNINNLTDVSAQAAFQRLIVAVEPTQTEDSALMLAQAVTDWVTPLSQQSEFDHYYLQLPEPYRDAHRLMVTPSELRLVKGVTASLYAALQPYITALPVTTLVNVSTATAPVLTTLSSALTLPVAKQIEQLRLQSPILSTGAFLNLDVVKNNHISADKMTVNSQYFLITTDVVIENQHMVLYTLVERTQSLGKVVLTILWQSKGVW